MTQEEITQIIGDETLQKIIQDYPQSANCNSTVGFNIFTLISDKYRHENFHSDIIKAFLDPHENHNEGNLFLRKFIEMLNKKCTSVSPIPLDAYEQATVERERHHIDILIKSKNSDRCIIENKLNGAQDMDRQLSRYYNEMKGQRYKVDAIVYLTRTEIEQPDPQSYEEIDKEDQNKILLIPAPTLIKKWINPCIHKTNNLEYISILRQYSRLLQSLFPTSKTHTAMFELYDSLDKNIKKLIKIKLLSQMLNDLPIAMAEILTKQLNEKYDVKKEDYIEQIGRIWVKDPDHSVIKLKKDFCIYVICHADIDKAYELNVVNWEMDITSMNDLNIDTDSDHLRGKGRYFKNYPWNSQETLLKDIATILAKLISFIQKQSSTDKAQC